MQTGQSPTTAERLDETPDGPDADACRRQLDRIRSSPEFDVSARQSQFLAYVVTEKLAGRADRIKAYSVATEVFGRDDSFDPQTDPIVRVEAGHLRRALDRYYLGPGRGDPVRISIPKGGYAPQFGWAAPSGAAAPADPVPADPSPVPRARPARRWLVAFAAGALLLSAALLLLRFTGGDGATLRPDIPRLLVQPFDDLSQPDRISALATGLTQEVIGELSKFRDILVLSGDKDGKPLAPLTGSADRMPRYILSGSIDIDAQVFRLQARLAAREDGQVLWANTYTGDLSVSRIIAIQQDIADQVATALAQPYGVIFQADAARQHAGAPEDWDAYTCTLSYYSYRISLDPAEHPVVRRCLEDAVARYPDYATAWGLLAQVYVDELRFRFAPGSTEGPTSVERALAAARTAVALDPRNIRGLQAEMLALFFSGSMNAAIDVGRTALQINPNDSELQGEVGYRLALAGQWEEGCALVAAARQSNPGPLGYYETALALCAYMNANLQDAAKWIRKSPLPMNPQYHLIAATIFGEMRDPDAAVEVGWIRQHAPHLFRNARAELEFRIGRTEDVDRFMSSLAKAGLPVGE